MRAFPDHPFLRGNYGPLLMECDAPDLVIEGEVPKDLAGTLYRNGPNPRFPPRGSGHHWFLGDGMIHGFHVADGKVSYRNRWVRTGKFKAESEAGEALFGSNFGPMGHDPRAADIKRNVANTNIVWHGGKLLALEEGNPPVELDPVTLATHGPWTFEDGWQGPFTAHPKIDPQTGEMLFFGYQAKGPASPMLAFGVVAADGRLTRLDFIEAPYCAMVHDFVVTDRHVIFPIFPATIDIPRIMAGGPAVAWDPSKPSRIGIMPRNGTVADLRWFTGEPCYVFHPMNAFADGDRVICDMMKYDRVPLFPDVDGGRPGTLRDTPARLVRWTFDLAGNSDGFSEARLDDLPGEFPRLDERFAGLGYRHGYFAAATGASDGIAGFDTIAHVDLESGQRALWRPGEDVTVMEPVFVPHGAAEGDGWLLTVTYRAGENRSDLAILDATDVAAGPVALARLQTRVPYGFHGNWRPE
jgi:carotenoid cleavage dioxygenase